MSMLSLIVLRKKEPNLERPFKAPFYPFFPMIAFILSMVCMVAIVYYNQTLGMIFFGLMLICLGGYYWKIKL
jgi:ethanolamine permease